MSNREYEWVSLSLQQLDYTYRQPYHFGQEGHPHCDGGNNNKLSCDNEDALQGVLCFDVTFLFLTTV